MFYKEWTRKMVHGRLQDFISSHEKTKKGGQQLRDKLFALKERKKREGQEKNKQAVKYMSKKERRENMQSVKKTKKVGESGE